MSTRWVDIEAHAKKVLIERFGMQFSKGKIIIGKPREFDLISEDKSVVAQVKSCKKFESLNDSQLKTRLARFVLDCILLEKTKAMKKIFILVADLKLYEWFIFESNSIISPEIEVMRIDPSEIP